MFFPKTSPQSTPKAQGSAQVHQCRPVPGPHGRVQQLGHQGAEDHLDLDWVFGWFVAEFCWNYSQKLTKISYVWITYSSKSPILPFCKNFELNFESIV